MEVADSARFGAEQSGFADFYGRELPALVRFVMRHGADVEEAVDAAQTAFVRALVRWDMIYNPRAWLRRVAYHEYLRRLREINELIDDPPDLPGPLPPDAHLDIDEQTRNVYMALSQLPYKQRQIMSWHYDGFSHAEIATELGMTEGAVRQNLHRARRALAEQLRKTEGGER
jgi:RNA polymerase sigma factor (sigma-70 family)